MSEPGMLSSNYVPNLFSSQGHLLVLPAGILPIQLQLCPAKQLTPSEGVQM